ncbi:putative folylpolyglutamate synthase [Aspergillus fijiensis CBS 313.89]|uniref:tetrahydrofolate synthase n=1 Tax=Aspergillus fijiensis CBS 313.89 TaxID=1448319 RepID=A0A8G1RDI6_9EURO|nr:putative folylpolyglutamate synthase [Aspergillus fijiensis CBS 313.89]RAK71782.1 putative folylpolyglutamate synthase [Aspergillus fijiensis CBS 313.89]
MQCSISKISDLDRLNIVHFGLFTSPHLITRRERICVNSEPLSEAKFAKYFFEIWNALELTAAAAATPRGGPGDTPAKPSYARFLTLMSFHAFMQEAVDTAIYEVGVGGQSDSTNIAWHKAGIFKKGCPAFTVPQVPQAMDVLQERAIEMGTHLNIVEVLAAVHGLDIKPAEHFQRQNASSAVRLAEPSDRLSALFGQGLENLDWKGRCQTLVTGQQHWYLDGAHTHESLEVACSWFGRVSGTRHLPRVLIFNQRHSSRDSIALLRTVHRIIYTKLGVVFQYAVFCANNTYTDQSCNLELITHNVNPDALQGLILQKKLATVWKELDPDSEVTWLPSIEDAVDYVKEIYNGALKEPGAEIWVTGSFHLVGGTHVEYMSHDLDPLSLCCTCFFVPAHPRSSSLPFSLSSPI